MPLFPELSLEIGNLGIGFVLYLLLFVPAVIRLPKDRRQWLFEDTLATIHGWRKAVLRLAQLVTFAYLILLCLTPLPAEIGILEIAGMLLYASGLLLVPLSLHFFGKAEADRPVIEGPYRYSRNPQWVGLFFVLFGLGLVTRAVGMMLLVVLIGLSYHLQILEEERLCLETYGQTYQAYMHKIPRYLLFR